MTSLSPNLRGPLLMLAATGSFVINDTMMKLATNGLPPLETLFLRGVTATCWCVPLVLLLGYRRQIPMIFNQRVLARNIFELIAVIGFVLALAHMPIADVTALGQITPLLILIGVSVLFREKIGALRIGLIALGFAGALLVAQPTGAGISVYALLAFSNATFSAARDIAGRRVPAAVPGMIVALCAILIVMLGAGAATLIFETWVVPDLRHVALLTGSGLFLMGGHFMIFTAYRSGETGIVAPFYYGFSVWAVVSSVVVFHLLPNAMALAGICLIVASGIVIVVLDERKRRLKEIVPPALPTA